MAQETQIGSVLGGRYRLVSILEEETLGRVYLAEDSGAASRKVRVKVLHPFLSDNKEKAARFEREVTATAQLDHPNLIKMLDEGRAFGVTWLVLEHFEAPSLKEVLEKGPLEPIRAAHIVAQVARALEVAHANGIIHRNIGPQNISLIPAPDGTDFVKLRDFGLAAVEEEGGPQLTSAAARIGNIAYMAPEYIESNTVDPTTDVYALGALLFQMITGRAPFVGNYGKVVEAHMQAVPPRAATIRPDAPDWVDGVVQRLMHKDPRHRPQTGAGVAKVLEKATDRDLAPPDLTARRGPLARVPASRVPVSSKKGAGGMKIAAAGAAGAGLMAAGAAVLLVIALAAIWYVAG